MRGFLDAWRLGGGVNYTARGLAYRWTPPFWGALRDTANAAHLALVHPPALKCHVLMHHSVAQCCAAACASHCMKEGARVVA